MSPSFVDHIKQHPITQGWKGTSAPTWQNGQKVYEPDPELCHCGQKALYRHKKRGFCKAHRPEAVAASTKSKHQSKTFIPPSTEGEL